MPTAIINLIIQVVFGAIGGNVAGAVKDLSLGATGNTIVGAIGGGIGGQLLQLGIPALAGSAGGLDVGSLVGQAAGGGIIGAVVTGIIGLIKNRMT